MKQFFSIVSALLLSGTMFAQTIAIDGANADWSTVPMLTEPGVGPVVKMVVPQDGLTLPEGTAYALMVEGDHEKILAGYPVIYTDADKNNETGMVEGETDGRKPWFCPSMGYDYQMATWSIGSLFGQNETGSVREMCIMQAAFSGVAFDGTIGAWLTFDWGQLYIPTAPDAEGWKWSENSYHPMYVNPYTYADLKGTHAAAGAYATHQALAPGATLNMKNAGSANDTLLWASWTVELTKPATYVVNADVTSTNTATVDLYLVDVATNKVVATFVSTDVWAPAGSAEYGEWDLSAVPAGKYMLKMKNHAAWSVMVLSSITLEEKATDPTGVEDVRTNTKATKLIKNGQLIVVRDNVQYNILGAEIR